MPLNSIKNKLIDLYHNRLFLNSFYLMLATAVMSGLGFFFWLINSRFFTTADIGLATTLISIMSLIAILSVVGFDNSFVRFLSKSKEKNDELNTGLLLSGLAAFFLSLLFIIFVPLISPQLAFIKSNFLVASAFILFCIMASLNTLTDSVFLAYRETRYTLIINTIFSLVKVALPFAFLNFGALGIFSSAALAQSVGFVLSIALMIKKMGYRPQFVINRRVLTRVWKFCAGNYVIKILNLLPPTLLPLLITNHLGAEQAAYYFMAMMIGNLLYVIPWSTAKSLLAEGSHDEKTFHINTKKSIRIIAYLLVPMLLIFLFGGSNILLIFGKKYSTEGLVFLQLVLVTSLAVSANSIYGSYFQITRNLKVLIFANACYAGVIVGLSYALLPFGLAGIGIAWLMGNSTIGLITYVTYHYQHKLELASSLKNNTSVTSI